MTQKNAYKQKAELGTLVAFKDEEGKVRSAKIVDREKDNELLVVETEYGMTFKVPYNKVLWVKTGTRWPKGVYKLLKGNHSRHEERKRED